MEADVLGEVEGVPSDGELDADELGDDEAVDEGEVLGLSEAPAAGASSTPIDHADLVSPSISSVNVPERSVPASYKSDEVEVIWKSSEPLVTLVKYAPLEVE